MYQRTRFHSKDHLRVLAFAKLYYYNNKIYLDEILPGLIFSIYKLSFYDTNIKTKQLP